MSDDICSIGQANGGKGTKVSIIFIDTALLAPAGSSLKALGASIGVDKIELPPGQIEPQVSPGVFLKTRPYVTHHQSASQITWSGAASFNIS